jgi:tRNA G18 (ribose-2'-O)-methylase SpoU
MRQLSHSSYEKKNHNLSIVVVCDKLQSSANLGSIVRISEAFGVSEIFIHSDDETFLNQSRFIKTSRHAFKNLDIKIYNEANNIIIKLKSKGFQIIALEKCDHSQILQDVKFKKNSCLIIGHESTGVNQAFLNNAVGVAHINTYGRNSSINVSQALALGLYECVRQQV